MKWRKTVRILHRDIGYVAIGLIIIYSISGIAVNHVADWNPNYIIENDTTKIESLSDSALTTVKMIEHVSSSILLDDEPVNIFRSGPGTIELFFDGKTIKADLTKGFVVTETVNSRTVIRETNFLHLNAPKKIWTYVADLFAVALIFLAVSGAIMMRGSRGITGRGKWLTAIGFGIPLIFLIMYY